MISNYQGKIPAEIPENERRARMVAEAVLNLQRRWAAWMNSKFAKLHPLTRKLAFAVFTGILSGWSLVLIFKVPPPIGKTVRPDGPQKRSSAVPSDRLLLMEYIYKSSKK